MSLYANDLLEIAAKEYANVSIALRILQTMSNESGEEVFIDADMYQSAMNYLKDMLNYNDRLFNEIFTLKREYNKKWDL